MEGLKDLLGDEFMPKGGSGSGFCTRHTIAHLHRGGHLDCMDVSPADRS